MSAELLIVIFERLNEALTTATVIVATSMLFYNLTHGWHDRVVRASSILLSCVVVAYLGDVFIALDTTGRSAEAWLRFEWIGIAFAPAALFHLSDALLATTGLISRGRRRRIVRILYLYGVVFLLTAVFTDLILRNLVLRPFPMMEAGPLFVLYLIYFVAAIGYAFNNVLRARRRCLTTATHRRMTYLLMVFLTPAAGIFPFTLLFSHPNQNGTVWLWLLVNLGNLGIILMLAFMAYPLSFFGSHKPDRVIKAELLRFMLRGPVTGVLVLLVMLFVRATRVFGLPGVEFMPFAAVATLLALEWAVTLIIPVLERLLVYTHDQDQARRLQEFGRRLLTRSDAKQLLESILAAVCDYLRAPSAFIASVGPNGVQLEQVMGPLTPAQSWLDSPEFQSLASPDHQTMPDGLEVHGEIMVWQSFWLVPLRSPRLAENSHGRLIGIMGIWARSPKPDLQPEEETVFQALYTRAARVLDDIRIEGELFERVEDVMRETSDVQFAPDPVRYGRVNTTSHNEPTVVDDPSFIDLIRDALRDYWGGPRLTESRLLQLNVVTQALAENEGNPARAVRAVLARAIESLKPEGQRSLTTTEWILYNIVEMRFIQGRKVKDVAPRLAMSEADLYRKQNIAIREVARKVAEMEKGTLGQG